MAHANDVVKWVAEPQKSPLVAFVVDTAGGTQSMPIRCLVKNNGTSFQLKTQ